MTNCRLTNEPMAGIRLATESPPEFGLIDVIEAFTAMRHEWRQQTKENRELAATMESTAQNILRFEENLAAHLGASTDQFESGQLSNEKNTIPDRSLNDLVDAIVEIDLYLSRAVEAATRAQALTRQESALESAIHTIYSNMNFVTRWFSRSFHKAVYELVKVNHQSHSGQAPSESIVDGLVLLESRLRRIMDHHQIVRREAFGMPFDATTMRAIGALPTPPDRPAMAGQVVEQVAPTYLWNGKVIRFAEVRVAR